MSKNDCLNGKSRAEEGKRNEKSCRSYVGRELSVGVLAGSGVQLSMVMTFSFAAFYSLRLICVFSQFWIPDFACSLEPSLSLQKVTLAQKWSSPPVVWAISNPFSA